jgi:hypothetical protein
MKQIKYTLNMKKLKAIIKCALIIGLIGFLTERSYAQGTLLDARTLERTMYENQQKRNQPFDGILEKHIYKTNAIVVPKDFKKLTTEIKKNENVISVLKQEDKIIILVKKSEMNDASYLITPFFESQKIPIANNYVLFYLKNN